MNHDVAYYSSNVSDRVFAIRKKVDSCSVSLATMSPCGDKYWDKKTIHYILSTLRDNGVLIVVADFSNIGSILAIMEEGKLSYNICCFYCDKPKSASSIVPSILVCVGKEGKKWDTPTLIVDNEPLPEMLIRSSAPQDVVLVVGNSIYQIAMMAKRTCRYVVGFFTEPFETLENEGIKMERIDHAT